MPSSNSTVQTYVDLAAWYHHQGQTPNRDRFLALAADAAVHAGLHEEAEQLYARLLRYNPHHLLKSFASFAEAMQSPDGKNFMAVLRRTHPPEEAQRLLASLGSNGNNKESGENRLERAPASWFEDPQSAQTATALDEVESFEDYPASAAQTAQPAPPASRPTFPNRSLPRVDPRPLTAPAPTVTISVPAAATRTETVVRPGPVPSKASSRPSRQAVDFVRTLRLPEEKADVVVKSWIASALFVLLLLTGAALGVYTLAQPLLPPLHLP
jgi:hypothetical protein